MRTTALAFTASALCLALVLACDDEEGDTPQDTGPVLGVMELPISLRNADSAPADAVRMEVSPTELRVDGATLLALEAGRVSAAEQSEDRITKLLEALQSGPARRAAALRLHVNTPYVTTALIIHTLKAANLDTVAFEVRKPGGGAETGWLVLDDVRVEPKSDEPKSFSGSAQRRWDELVQHWDAVYEACRRDHYVDCGGKPFNPAEGGEMEISLFARGSALKAEFTRFGVEDGEPAPRAGPQMIDGVPAPPTAEGEEDMGPPATTGAFTWRFRAATDEGESPISGAFRPLCGAQPCGVVVTGDPETMTMRLVAFLGAAFPNGTEAPATVFEIPRS